MDNGLLIELTVCRDTLPFVNSVKLADLFTLEQRRANRCDNLIPWVAQECDLD